MVIAAWQELGRCLWSSYDEESDALYIRFRESNVATDGELANDDNIFWYDSAEIVGMTFFKTASDDG